MDETFNFILKGAKDQDIYMFIAFLAGNIATRRRMATFFMDNYDEVRHCENKIRRKISDSFLDIPTILWEHATSPHRFRKSSANNKSLIYILILD